MLRILLTLFFSFLLGFASPVLVSYADDTPVRTRRESSQRIVVRKSKKKSIVHREEIVGSILKIEQHAGKSLYWISLRGEDGEPVENLNPRNFHVTESVNGVARSIPAAEIEVDNTPLLSVLLRDMSGSMTDWDLRNSSRAITSYVSKMRPQDKTALIFFSTRVAVVQTFTTAKRKLLATLKTPFERSNTSLYDSIIFAFQQIQSFTEVRFKSVILVLTDGGDTASKNSLDDVLALALSGETPIFTIGIGRADLGVLQQISKRSRGLYFHPQTTEALDSVYQRISRILRGSVVFSFPSLAKSGDSVDLNLEVSTSTTGEKKKMVRFFGHHIVP